MRNTAYCMRKEHCISVSLWRNYKIRGKSESL